MVLIWILLNPCVRASTSFSLGYTAAHTPDLGKTPVSFGSASWYHFDRCYERARVLVRHTDNSQPRPDNNRCLGFDSNRTVQKKSAFPTSAPDAPSPVRESEDSAFGRLHFSTGYFPDGQVGVLNVLQLIRFVFREAVDDLRLTFEKLVEVSATRSPPLLHLCVTCPSPSRSPALCMSHPPGLHRCTPVFPPHLSPSHTLFHLRRTGSVAAPRSSDVYGSTQGRLRVHDTLPRYPRGKEYIYLVTQPFSGPRHSSETSPRVSE